jgi:hypothetical protein
MALEFISKYGELVRARAAGDEKVPTVTVDNSSVQRCCRLSAGVRLQYIVSSRIPNSSFRNATRDAYKKYIFFCACMFQSINNQNIRLLFTIHRPTS